MVSAAFTFAQTRISKGTQPRAALGEGPAACRGMDRVSSREPAGKSLDLGKGEGGTLELIMVGVAMR